MGQTYLEETRGVITASKLKDFITNPNLYKLKYVDEVVLEEEEERYFITGNAFHYLMEHGEETFLEKYSIADGYLKADLSQKILKRASDGQFDGDDIEVYMKGLKKLTLSGLREERYGTKDYHLMSNRIQLTKAEGDMVLGMYKSCLSQPIFGLGNEGYICEERLEAEYLGEKIGMKPDRRLVHNKVNKTFSLSDLNELLLGKSKDQQKVIIAEKGLTSILRDFKTTADVIKIKNDLSNGYDDYGYKKSMAFYYTVIYVLYGLKSVIYLDFVDKRPPHLTEVIALKVDDLEVELQSTIIPALDGIIRCKESGDYQKPTREEIFSNKELTKFYHFFDVPQTEPTFI